MIFIIGIDVSSHQGIISWDLVGAQIDFCMIRAGYGKNHIDDQADRNAEECRKWGIPFGLYWFSYATNAAEAAAEADFLCNFADKYKPELPLAFDFEYDSDAYAVNKGVKTSNTWRIGIANAFINRVTERGYKPLLYTNLDYYRYKGFNLKAGLVPCPLWLAYWGANKPDIECIIWQKSATGEITGISGNVDINEGFFILAREDPKRSAEDIICEIKKLCDTYLGTNYGGAVRD